MLRFGGQRVALTTLRWACTWCGRSALFRSPLRCARCCGPVANALRW